MKTKDTQLLEEAYNQIFLKESEIIKNGTNILMIQHPKYADYSQGPRHPEYGRMKTTGNYPGKEDVGLKGTIIGFDNNNESGLGSKLTYHIELENGKTRTYVSPESFKVLEEAYNKINEMDENKVKVGLIEDYIRALTYRSEASGDEKLAFAMNFVRSTLEALVEDAYGYETLRDDLKKLRT